MSQLHRAASVPPRIESDLLGSMEIPGDAYWGIHTARAKRNFPISGVPVGSCRHLVRALATVKEAAARTNLDLGLLEAAVAEAIIEACHEVARGALDAEFHVDLIQGGAGTSTNMNANEVIANRALELLGRARGEYALIHPNEHVNLGQSTNDAYPTALRLALYWMIEDLLADQQKLHASLARKGREFAGIRKLGRTQLQDAVPMTLGQEFDAFAGMVEDDIGHLAEAATRLLEINLGGTAIGTGINAHPQYAERVRDVLCELTGLDLVTATDLVRATPDCGDFVLISSALKRCAVRVSKICNDLRLLSSGPRGGLGELTLPERQAGSSIMPGKVNPVIPEVVNQIAFQIIGNDLTVTLAAEAGQLQLNAFEPIIAQSLFTSVRHLASGCHLLAELCIDGITAQSLVMDQNLQRSLANATILSPVIGYTSASKVARAALSSGRTVHEVVLELGLLSEADMHRTVSVSQPSPNGDGPACVEDSSRLPSHERTSGQPEKSSMESQG